MNRAERRRLEKLAKKQSKRKPSEADNSSVEPIFNLAKQFQAAGKTKEARDLLEHALKSHPNEANLLNLLGIIYFQQEEFVKAEDILSKAVLSKPNDADFHNNLGSVYEQQDKLEQAVDQFQQAIEIEKNHRNAHYNLGYANKLLKNLEEALKNFQNALSINPKDQDALLNLADTYQSLSLDEEALSTYLRIEKLLSHPSIKLLKKIAYQLMDLGRFEEAESKFREIISIDPTDGASFRFLTRINNYSSEEETDVQQMKAAFSTTGISDDNKMHLAFALGSIYENLSQYQQAFDYLLLANELKRKTFDYSVDTDRKYFSDLKHFFDSINLESNQLEAQNQTNLIFIVGMPRSGTSLIEQILSSHPKVHGAGELDELSQLEEKFLLNKTQENNKETTHLWDLSTLELCRDHYLTTINKLCDESEFITDKMPHNFKYIGFIRLMFPKAIIINTLRNPLDNCLSIFKNYFSTEGHPYAWDLQELGEYYREYSDLMHFWQNRFPDGVYQLQYEDVINDPENQIRKLIEHCGLEWDAACLNFHKTDRSVKTASAVQVRKKIYSSSIDLWTKYGNALYPLKQELDKLA